MYSHENALNELWTRIESQENSREISREKETKTLSNDDQKKQKLRNKSKHVHFQKLEEKEEEKKDEEKENNGRYTDLDEEAWKDNNVERPFYYNELDQILIDSEMKSELKTVQQVEQLGCVVNHLKQQQQQQQQQSPLKYNSKKITTKTPTLLPLLATVATTKLKIKKFRTTEELEGEVENRSTFMKNLNKTTMKIKKSEINNNSPPPLPILKLGVVEQSIETDEPCTIIDKLPHISPELAQKYRNEIAVYFSSEDCPIQYRLSPRFESTELTAEKLQYIFNVVDDYFYSGTLLKAITEKGIRIFYGYEKLETQIKKKQPGAKTVAVYITKKDILKEIHFIFNQNRYGNSANCRKTNGIQVNYKLEALIVTICHELVHALLYAFCPEFQGHGEKFLLFNSKLHGADPEIYSYQDSSTHCSFSYAMFVNGG